MKAKRVIAHAVLMLSEICDSRGFVSLRFETGFYRRFQIPGPREVRQAELYRSSPEKKKDPARSLPRSLSSHRVCGPAGAGNVQRALPGRGVCKYRGVDL